MSAFGRMGIFNMISVVIPAHNEEKLLPLCLESLCKQKTKKDFEVIVVDNCSTDGTIAAAKLFAKKLHICIFEEKEKGRGMARFTGFANAKGEIIFSTDADTTVPPNWIEHLSSAFSNPKVVAVAGKVVVKDLHWIQNNFFRIWQRTGEVGYRIIFGHWWLGGYSFAIRKSVYIKSGGFSKTLNALEDVDLSMKVRKQGKIVQINNKVVFSGRRYRKGFLRNGVKYLTTFGQYAASGAKSAFMDDVR